MDRDVLDELVASKDLDPSVEASVPTFDINDTLTWTAATSDRIYFEDNQPYQCISTTNLDTQSDTVPAPERPKNFCWP